MTKRKGPQMANAAEEALSRELESLVENAAENLSEEEFAERERKADEIIKNVRDRVSRRERA
jgi:ElaB/YqjD/DUF883 family membrane-anchored ribosome-binding protein